MRLGGVFGHEVLYELNIVLFFCAALALFIPTVQNVLQLTNFHLLEVR